jgi:hypothetical protein
MADWPDDHLLLPESDNTLCWNVREIEHAYALRNAALREQHTANMQTSGSNLGPRSSPAPCVQRRSGEADLSGVVPAGWLLETCPRSTFANQLVHGKVLSCTRSHQPFMNMTRRGTGTVPERHR